MGRRKEKGGTGAKSASEELRSLPLGPQCIKMARAVFATLYLIAE